MNNTIQEEEEEEEEEEEVEEKQMSTANNNSTSTPALLPTEFNSLINSLPLQNEPFLDAPPQPSIETHRFVWKQITPPPPQVEVQVQDDNGDDDEGEDDDEDEDEDENEEYEEIEGFEEGDGDGNGDEVVAETTAEELIERKKKLADGFFEVQSIRKKRVCKGEPQYLIKWRGWPESANTWEPVDHLQTCPDIVEAYEKSLQSGQKKSYRKRKRKFTQQKKKMQFYYGATKSKVSPVKLSLSNEEQDSASLDSNNNVGPHPSMVDVVVKHEETIKRSVTKKVDDNGFTSISPTIASFEKDHSKSLQLSGQNAIGIHSVVHLEKDGPGNQLLKSTCVETGQRNQRRGAQRRKSGSVRRFKQDETSLNVNCLKTPLPVNGSASKRPEQPMIGNSDASRKRKSDSSKSSVITKIIKPISYSASATNNVHDVAVTFLATRSDGKEVLVDNKFLKATNPLLLINFYEQHLRYNPA